MWRRGWGALRKLPMRFFHRSRTGGGGACIWYVTAAHAFILQCIGTCCGEGVGHVEARVGRAAKTSYEILSARLFGT